MHVKMPTQMCFEQNDCFYSCIMFMKRDFFSHDVLWLFEDPVKTTALVS